MGELFLLGWAVAMTVYAGWKVARLKAEKRAIIELVGEICLGDVKPTITHGGQGFYVENDACKLGGVRKTPRELGEHRG